MAQKITLSIPDMLHEKLKDWRDSFNFSKMFQETLIEAIQKKEELAHRFSQDMDLPDIIKRLRQEKMEWEKQFYKIGKKEGDRWARSVRYENLLYVSNCADGNQLLDHDHYREYFQEQMKTCGLSDLPHEQKAVHEKQFVDGWSAGVKEFWNIVKEKI